MWDDRSVLDGIGLAESDQILDVGCGSGILTRILGEESTAWVVGVDADLDLLTQVTADARVGGDACRLPFRANSFDLVICQALLINLADPIGAVTEFSRVSRDRVVAIEPDNSRVQIESTVAAETRLSKQARQAYLESVKTDPALGRDTAELFREAGLTVADTRRYEHTQSFEPPYSQRALTAAQRRARASQLDDMKEAFVGDTESIENYGEFRDDWQSMGREVIKQMQEEEYRRSETVPFFVVVGRHPRDGDGLR